jgi:cytochrome c oxidase assembly protein subunit 11
MAAKTDIKKTSLVLAAITVLMFGFGYALVPLYNVFCEITGLNGNKAISVVLETESSEIAQDRWVDVQFDSNVNGDLPWRMKAKQINMKVQPGKFYEATFTVENMKNNDVVGQAIPTMRADMVIVVLYSSATLFSSITKNMKEAPIEM